MSGSGTDPDDPAVADPPATDLSFLDDELTERDAAGFVHVGDRFDDDLRYLTRFAGPDRDYALVVVPGRAVLCAPALFREQAAREFVAGGAGDPVAREVRTTNRGDPAGVRAAAVLDDLGGGCIDRQVDGGDNDGHADDSRDDDSDNDDHTDDSPILVPQHLPHDAAVHLEHAGYDLESTPAVTAARETKTDAELACLRRVQAVAIRGMARAESVLAEAAAETDPDADRVVWEGAPLTTERLRREVNAELARRGVRDAGNTVIGAGPTCADLHFTGLDEVQPGETVLLDISPRGPNGYYGDVTRTFGVHTDGGWERRAYVAVEAAREAALAEIEAGVPAATVHEEGAAELAAHGFRIDSSEVGFTHGTGHGVGLSLHEGPSLSGEATLRAGHVVTVEPGVYDPERGGVRIEDLVAVTDDGSEVLAPYPIRFTPES